MAVTAEDIVRTLEEIALLLELKGENQFKTRAYRNAIDIVQSFDGDFVQEAREGDIKKIKGIGDALAKKLKQLCTEGKMEYYEDLKAEFPDGILELFELQGVGGKKIKAVYDALGVATIADLKKACESGEVAKLPGFGAKSAAKILEAIAFREEHDDLFRLGDVAGHVEAILEDLKSHPETLRAEIAGSFRRGKEVLHDLDFIVATNEPQQLMDFFVGQPWVKSVIVHGSTKSSIRLENGCQCDLRAVSNKEFPFAIAYFTGSKEHNVAMRGRALKRGYTLNEYRLAPVEDKEQIAYEGEIHTEEDLHRALGVEYIDPALRENRGEIEAAENGELPKLVELENLKGTFHCHTTESDGKDSLENMVAAAQELGLQYLGITDHSKGQVQARGLDEERLLKQIEAIKKLNKEIDGFYIFAGNEVDILRDGSLDFDDEILAKLDFTVASIHGSLTLSEDEMTKRVIKAAENPHVTMLGHITGRLLLARDPYSINLSKIIDAAAETGTIIELNCNSYRLDMDWRWWKTARDKGVKCSINPDAHRVSGFQHLALGVKVGRKGWLRKEDVINTLPLAKVKKELAKKRA